ncbi:hypothetical protein VNO77_32805 [Canavalia gladiata]|uniref:Syringolide-induced protein 14-1-1 n=1 Tax=Canavalia gladiata TaxID=3824 RepID=A0AAN9KQ60_CANGL
MEKQQSKLGKKILRIIPKAAAAVAVTFQNPPFSPGRDHKLRSSDNTGSRLKAHGVKGFSGPIVSMIPDEARRKPKGGGIETQEPTSPKISCMGQIKHKKKQQIKKEKVKSMSMPTHAKGVSGSASSTPRETEEKKHVSKLQRMFFHTAKPKTAARKSNASASDDAAAPPLGQMRRFASGRETFSNFDWKAQIAPEEIDHRDYSYSDDDRVESDGEDDVIIPFSAPIMLGAGAGAGRASAASPCMSNLKPRKEINLWKRRTMAPPRPLQLNPVLTAK